MAKYFRFPWAINGNKTAIPDATQSNGAVSYQQGYGPAYAANPTTDPSARDIERVMYNQALFDITENVQEYSQFGTPDYITAADNGGTAFPYAQYARVQYNPGSGMRVYESIINNNTNLPTVTTAWRLVDFTGLDARYGLGSTTPLRTGTANGNLPLIGTPGTTAAGANSAVVVRQGSNTNGFFRVWSDGLIMQWQGGIFPPPPATTVSVTFPISYANLSSVVVVVSQSDEGASNRTQFGSDIHTVRANTFNIVASQTGFVCNYISFGF